MRQNITALFLTLLSLCASCVLGQVDTCVGFTYGDCLFNDDDVVSSYTLPGNTDAFVLCQDLCQAEDDCAYFKYDSAASSCLLYRAFDILACQTISGDTSPDVGQCLPDPTSSKCKDIRQVDCNFNGLDSVVVEDVLDPYECQDILRAIGTGFFSTYFVYRGEDLTCSLLTSSGRQCPTVVGPAYPDFETECNTIPTTTEAIGTTIEAGLTLANLEARKA